MVYAPTMTTPWDEHETWRRKTPGAMAVNVTRSGLIDLVVGERRPWVEDEYIGAMRRLYLRQSVECPIHLCRAFVRYLIPEDYIHECTERSVPHPGGNKAGGGRAPVRSGKYERRESR